MIATAELLKLGKPKDESSRSNNSLKAPPTTMVGSTKGTVTSALSQIPDFPEARAIKAAQGIASAVVTAVETAACHVVNQIASRVRGELKMLKKPPQPSFNELVTMFATG